MKRRQIIEDDESKPKRKREQLIDDTITVECEYCGKRFEVGVGRVAFVCPKCDEVNYR